MDFLPCLCAAPIFALAAGVSVALPLRVFVCALVDSVVAESVTSWMRGCVFPALIRREVTIWLRRFRDEIKAKFRCINSFIHGGFQNEFKFDRESIKSTARSVDQRALTG